MLEELLPEDKRRLHELEMSLAQLEKGNAFIKVSDISLGIIEMENRLEALEKIVNKESKNRRIEMRKKVDHLRTTHAHIKSSLESYKRRNYRQDFDLQRKELYGNAVTSNSVEIDIELAENTSLRNSTSMVNEYLASGQATLSELQSQRERLKSAQTKVLDVLNLLGVSNSIMRAIERREWTDKWIVMCGMVVTLIFIAFVYVYLR
jgi:Golgi SNAP receptor complex protein 2